MSITRGEYAGWTGVALAFVLGTWLGAAAPARGDDLPLFSGNTDIARQFLHGKANVLVLGDSIQNGMISAYPKYWRPDHWVGQVPGPGLGFGWAGSTGGGPVDWTAANGYPSIATADTYSFDQLTTSTGISGIAPGYVKHITLGNGTAGADLATSRLYGVSLEPNQSSVYAVGNWADRDGVTLHADALVYANPNAIRSGLRFEIYQGSSTPLASVPVDVRTTASGLVKVSATVTAGAWQNGAGLDGVFRLAPGTPTVAGDNLVVAGVRYYTGEDGLQLANISRGGSRIDYYLDTQYTTDKGLDEYVDGTGTNVLFAWIGQNDPGFSDAPTWKNKVLQLMSRYRAANPDMKFVLVASYDTGNPLLGDYAHILRDISQSDPDVLFLNVYKAGGTFDTLWDPAHPETSYLSDGVHPSLAGVNYFGALSQTLMEQAAAAPAPEPGIGGAGVALALAVLARRRRRAA